MRYLKCGSAGTISGTQCSDSSYLYKPGQMATATLDFARRLTLYLGRRERSSGLGGILLTYKNVAVAEVWLIEKPLCVSAKFPNWNASSRVFLEVSDDIDSTDPPPGW